MKKFSSYQDITNKYDSTVDRWVLNLRPFGLVPSRPKFKTKAEATEFAKQAFERWLNRDSDDECAVTKPDIPRRRQCFKNFLAMSLERAHDPDEKFTLGSQQNHIDNVIALNKLTINDQRLEKMMLRSVGKSVVESVWKSLRKSVAARTADDRFSTFKQAIRLSFKQRYIARDLCELAEITLPNFDEDKIKRTIAACAKVQFSTLEKIVQHCAPEDRLKIIFVTRTGSAPRGSRLPSRYTAKSIRLKAASILTNPRSMSAPP
jgi:hypothetical protein